MVNIETALIELDRYRESGSITAECHKTVRGYLDSCCRYAEELSRVEPEFTMAPDNEGGLWMFRTRIEPAQKTLYSACGGSHSWLDGRYEGFVPKDGWQDLTEPQGRG